MKIDLAGQEVYGVSVKRMKELIQHLSDEDIIAIFPHVDTLLLVVDVRGNEPEHVGIINVGEEGAATYYDEGF